MFWFKNAIIYRLTKQLDWSTEKLQEKLQQCAYRPCDKSDVSKFGWTNPIHSSELLYHAAENKILLVAQKEEKILPVHVVNNALNKRIEEFEKIQGRKLEKIEKLALKDDVIAVLLQQAFSKYKQTALFIDLEKGLIYVDASSYKTAEDVLALLRKTLGSLPVVPLSFVKDPHLVMTSWLGDNPTWLVLLEEAEFTGTTESGLIKCKNQDLNSEEIDKMLESDKVITKLSLEWEDNLSFILNEDGTLKRLKFADNVLDKNDDIILKEDYTQRFDADFILMTSVLSELTENLLNEFGGEKEHD
ncbi:recombination-associated protein RdgC [Pasteurella multocida]|uniref:recombination-associated protein RdgC n=2 Tax=Pasteurella multocida TaxID=747 RepID=UPI0009991F4F|nr:recombination-associated protein RdgC [Pasteurella multocida]MBE7394605.1 recombination-associated protein RdgC [Pasteurella multocida]MCL7755745.1 recombination-associated protein RdgC [Pasteurella multocida]MCL7779872.1 recombination-associated protein RdgC [Pasteurella multocida]OPC91174.1 recombination-associated protein RdgC [Pasteurella multocida subsp. septica]OPD03800.1 recombination-associated protein RdgC [Pasteurella multocida subsp. septica]